MLEQQPNKLDDLLKLPPYAQPEAWQSGITSVLEAFISQIKTTRAHQADDVSLMNSYMPDSNSAADSEAATEILHYCFNQLGIATTVQPLDTASTLEAQLAQSTYAVILCIPAYAQKVEQEPSIRQILNTFGKSKKNALQPLLCEGGFADTALTSLALSESLQAKERRILTIDCADYPGKAASDCIWVLT